jgi:hypothetical protein
MLWNEEGQKQEAKIAALLEIEIDCCRLQSLQSWGLMALIVMSLMILALLFILFVAALSYGSISV